MLNGESSGRVIESEKLQTEGTGLDSAVARHEWLDNDSGHKRQERENDERFE